jgi:hypothetical protein
MITRNRPTHRGAIRVVEMDLTGDDIVLCIKTTPPAVFDLSQFFSLPQRPSALPARPGRDLSRVNGVHADLLVAGAGAHPRGLAHVLGAVTCTMHETSAELVLLSHCIGAQL